MKIKLLAIIVCTLMLTGCWGIIDIENTAFVLSLGIDKISHDELNKESRYEITIVNPDTAEAEEGKVLKSTIVIGEGSSFNMSIVRLMQRFSKNLNYEHTRIFLLGEKLLEDDKAVKNILDTLTRDRQFHTSMLILMVPEPNKISDTLSVKPKTKTLLSFYIQGIAEHELYSARIGRILFHDFVRLITTNHGAAVIPIVIPDTEEVNITGMGVLKDYKLIGKLDSEETVAYRWCDGRVKGGVLETEEPGFNPPFIYRSFNRKIKMEKIDNDVVYLKYKMAASGAIEKYTLDGRLVDDSTIKELEKRMEEYMKKQCEEIISKFQKEYKVDLIGAGDYLRKYQPKLYEKVSKDFDDFFQNNLVIDVDISIKVRRIGKIL